MPCLLLLLLFSHLLRHPARKQSGVDLFFQPQSPHRMLEHLFSRLNVPWNIRSLDRSSRKLSFPRTNKPGRPLPTGWTVDRCHRGNLDLYQLAPILYKELSYVGLQVSLVSGHVCAGTSGRPVSACKGGWWQCCWLTRPDSWQRWHCSTSCSRIYTVA